MEGWSPPLRGPFSPRAALSELEQGRSAATHGCARGYVAAREVSADPPRRGARAERGGGVHVIPRSYETGLDDWTCGPASDWTIGHVLGGEAGTFGAVDGCGDGCGEGARRGFGWALRRA